MPIDRSLLGCTRLATLGVFMLACTGSVTEPRGGAAGSESAGAGASAATGATSGSNAGASAGGAVGGSGGDAASAGSGAQPSAGASGSGAGSSPVSACDSAAVDPGPSPLSLLTRTQYLNVLHDLFGSVPDLSVALAGGARGSTIGAGQGDISQVELEDYQRAAEIVAADVVQGERLAELVPCADGANARECASSFVASFGARAYRAPFSAADDIERHLVLYDAGAATDHRHGIELLVRGMLQSTRFLYRVELGTEERTGESAVALSGYEIAARLALSFWNTLPDAELTAAAENGRLSTPEGVEQQLARLLADARGKDAVRRFLSDFVQLEGMATLVKDPALFPEFQDGALRPPLVSQATRFFDSIVAEQGGGLAALLTSTTVFVNRELGPYYGTTGGDDFTALELSEEHTAGLLTLPALLALTSKPDESSPIYRGKFVREMLLCQPPPAPPPDIPPAPEVDPDVSTRERLRQHEVDPACSGCHALLDPIGFGFENFDAIGRYRTSDGGEPVDASGEIFESGEIDGPFVGVRELAERLAASATVRDCVAKQWFRHVLRRFEEGADACSVERLTESFRDSGANLNALPAAIVRVDAFRYRRPIDPSASP
jgi:hypothetical protein